MKRNEIFIVIASLALFGFIVSLFRNPMALLTSILSLVLFGAIVVFIIHLFSRNRRSTNEMKKYKQAVKQSKERYQQTKRRRRRRPSHLRVIDGGNKGDRKSTRLNSGHVAISYAVFYL